MVSTNFSASSSPRHGVVAVVAALNTECRRPSGDSEGAASTSAGQTSSVSKLPATRTSPSIKNATLPASYPAAVSARSTAERLPRAPVDFTQLSGATNNAHNHQLLSLLQQDGIIALQNVPQYSSLRREFLEKAADCAVRAQQHGAEFLLHRQLRDGTNRYTVSLKSGLQLDDTLTSSPELLRLCPEYVQVHAAFSSAVELAVASVGSALDATQLFNVMVEQEVAMTARRLMEESVHLDHFHAYQAASGVATAERELEVNMADLSLELHTDNGLMIAMSAPEYFDLSSSGQLQHKTTAEQDAGLFIQTAAGEIVRPVLKSDELILMLGSGIDDWIKTTPPLHSVLHGMRYPRGVSVSGDGEGHTSLRAWFGKMVLLEAHHVMGNTGITFGQYANQTTRYLVQESEDSASFGAVACPPQRHLAASDNSCSLKTCTLKSTASASDLTYSCQVTCNHDDTASATQCSQYCDCETSTKTGTTCWMLCVENFSSDVCPGEQECNNASTEDKLAMTCVGGTSAPATTSSPASSTGSPSSNTSTTTAPSLKTTAPSTTTPATTTATATTSPATSAPSPGGSLSAGSTATEGSASTPTNVGDVSASASAADATSSTSSSNSSNSSSTASVLHVAFFVNGLAVAVAVFLCIHWHLRLSEKISSWASSRLQSSLWLLRPNDERADDKRSMEKQVKTLESDDELAEVVERIISETIETAEIEAVEDASERDYSVVATLGSSDTNSVNSLGEDGESSVGTDIEEVVAKLTKDVVVGAAEEEAELIVEEVVMAAVGMVEKLTISGTNQGPKDVQEVIERTKGIEIAESGTASPDEEPEPTLNESVKKRGRGNNQLEEATDTQKKSVSSFDAATPTKSHGFQFDPPAIDQVVYHFEPHQDVDNQLDDLPIGTKRDFISGSQQSSEECRKKQKLDDLLAQSALDETKTKAKAVARTPKKTSSVRNMASRFEKKEEQSLDNLSFRTVRSFFPTEKSVHVGAEKQKYEDLKQKAEDPATTTQKSNQDEEEIASPVVEKHPSASVKNMAHRFETKREKTIVRTLDTFLVPNSEASVRVSAEKAKYEGKGSQSESTPVVRTIDTFLVPDSEASVHVAAEKAKFERKSSQLDSAPKVRTLDTFLVPESDASVRVAAEKAKFERKSSQSDTAPVVRTLDTFLVPESEASVRVAAEKAKFERKSSQSDKAPMVRTLDTFLIPDSEASVRVAAEKAKFESKRALPDVNPVVRTVDTFIVPESEASVRVAAEKAKYESKRVLEEVNPVVRTLDTFLVPESEVSVHVSAEKAKLEALEKQKALEARQRAEKYKKSQASALASSEDTEQAVDEVDKEGEDEHLAEKEAAKHAEGESEADQVKQKASKAEVVNDVAADAKEGETWRGWTECCVS